MPYLKRINSLPLINHISYKYAQVSDIGPSWSSCYFWVLAELEQNNELILSHEETKIINPSKIFKSEECIICLENQPIILFCNCGHISICTECYKLKSLSTCPICKTENEIIRTLE